MSEKFVQRDQYKSVEPQLLDTEAKEALEKLRQELQVLISQLASPKISRVQEKAMGNEMVAMQKQKLPQIYGGATTETPYLHYHDTQKERYSCQLASASNILKALGFEITENNVALAMGKTGSQEGSVWPHELNSYLESWGLEVKKVSSALEAIEALLSGAKIILPRLPPKFPYPHTVIISGISINHGKIEFYVNDPQYNNSAEIVPLDHIIDDMIPYSCYQMTPVNSVSKPGNRNIE